MFSAKILKSQEFAGRGISKNIFRKFYSRIFIFFWRGLFEPSISACPRRLRRKFHRSTLKAHIFWLVFNQVLDRAFCWSRSSKRLLWAQRL